MNLSDLKKIQWATSNRWDIKFITLDDIPSFLGWLPFTDLEFAAFGISPKDFANSGIKIPEKSIFPTLVLSWNDNEYEEISESMTKWTNEIIDPFGEWVSAVNSNTKIVMMKRDHSQMIAPGPFPIRTDQPDEYLGLRVKPTGTILRHYNSVAEVNLFTMEFTVLGTL